MYVKKSMDGLWVKAEQNGDLGHIEVFWQMRYRRVGANVEKVDANGEVIETKPLREARWHDAWMPCGFIDLNRIEIVRMVEHVKFLPDLYYGMERHLVELIIAGWGNQPEEVVEWFDKPEDAQWLIVDMPYQVEPSEGSFEGLDGLELQVVDVGKFAIECKTTLIGGEVEEFTIEGEHVISEAMMVLVPDHNR